MENTRPFASYIEYWNDRGDNERQVTSTNRRESCRTFYPISGGFRTANFHLWS